MAAIRKPSISRVDEMLNEDGELPDNPMPGEVEFLPVAMEIEELRDQWSTGDEEIQFRIFRQGPGGAKDVAFIKTVPPDQFSYELLQSSPFNGGNFRVWITAKGKAGALKRNFAVTVEPDPKALAALNAPTAAASVDSAMAAMIAAMQSGFTAMNNQMQQIASRAPAQSGMDVEQTIKLLAALQPMNQQPMQRERDPLDMLTKILAIQKDIAPLPVGGEVDGGVLMLKALETFGKPLAEIMAAGKAAQAAPAFQNPAPRPMPQLAAPTEPAPTYPDPQSAQEPIAMDELTLKLNFIKPMVLTMAAQNADTYSYAGMICDVLTSEEIEKNITADDWWPRLTALMPEAAPYQTWFGELRANVIEMLREPDESDSLPQSGPPAAA